MRTDAYILNPHGPCVSAAWAIELETKLEKSEAENAALTRELALWERGNYYKPKMQERIDQLRSIIQPFAEYAKQHGVYGDLLGYNGARITVEDWKRAELEDITNQNK